MSWIGRTIRLTDGGFWRGFFGLGTHSGETVTAEKALQLDAVWACVKLKSEAVGTLPCMVYDADGLTPAKDHPLYELLHDEPNADMTAVEFWECLELTLMLYGNFFAEKKTNAGRLVALYPLHPECVRVERTASTNERVYRVMEEGKTRTLTERQVFHVRGLTPPGSDVGMAPVTFARQTFGNAIAAEKTAGKMFANGMQAAGVLSSDQVLKKEQRGQLAEIMGQYAGSDRAGKLMILEAGLKYQQLSLNPEDAQMLETRLFGVEQICRWFGVPPVMVGHAANGTTTWGSGVEQLILQFVKTGLRPDLKRIEAAIRRDLLTPEERRSLKVEFNMEGLLRGDSAARSAFYSTMVQNGILDRNEVRALENRPSRPEAGQLTAQTNLAPLDQLGAAASPAGQFEGSMVAMIEAAVERQMAKQPQTRQTQ
ncbi:phage portal protein, HK97 family [Stappia sp. 22II-S9-Z10]|nr:phage portal protein, HK97 family [Stappia sp. 22II-S9-Z10]